MEMRNMQCVEQTQKMRDRDGEETANEKEQA